MEAGPAEAREQIQAEINKATRRWQGWRRAYQALVAEYALAEPDPAILQYQLERLQGLGKALPQHQAELNAQAAEIKQRYQQRALRYEGVLREQCQAAGYRVSGRAPELIVDGLIKVQLDTNKNQARVNGKRITPMAIARVVEAIASEEERLWGRTFEAATFLSRLRTVYAKVSDQGSGPMTARAVFDALAADDKDYTYDMFAADLAKLADSRVTRAADGSRLALGPSRDTRQAVWVPHMHRDDGRYVGLIEFKSS